MRSRLWIINSALIALFIIVVLILVVGRPAFVAPKKLNFVPNALPARSSVMPAVDQVYIYEHDPFGTLGGAKAIEQPTVQKVSIAPVPASPIMQQEMPAQAIVPSFLPPLTIVLKGIIYAQQENDHRAIIEDKKTKREELYRTGDIILDAEIIRIESNKVMFLRSNGQQETVYVSYAEAHKDPLYQRAEGKYAASIPVRKISDTQFVVDPQLFVSYVNNLAQFFDALDVTTVFEKGRSIGCRVGVMAPHSIGILCGLQSGDIVTTVNDISTGTTKERLAIYQQIIEMQEGSVIKVALLRGDERKPINITYTLSSFAPKRVVAPPPQQTDSLIPSDVQSFLKQTPSTIRSTKPNKNTGTIAEKMRKNDKRAMVSYGGKSMAQRSNNR
jgi:type II secretory pathway component PulC